MIPASAMPYRTALVYTYDCGDFGKNLEDCLKLADYAGFAARRASRNSAAGCAASAFRQPSKPPMPA